MAIDLLSCDEISYSYLEIRQNNLTVLVGYYYLLLCKLPISQKVFYRNIKRLFLKKLIA